MSNSLLLDPLKRKQFYPAIHAFRGIGCLFILVFHSIGLFSPGNALIEELRPICLIFVTYFFMVSGFVNFRPLMVKVLKGETPSTNGKGFIIRRFARIYPGYWFALLLWTFIPGDDKFANGNIIPHIFLYHVFMSHGGDYVFAGIFVSWSLAIEVAYLFPVMFFYYLAGKIKNAFSKRYLIALVLSFALLIIASNFYHFYVVSKDVKSGEQWLFFSQWDKFATGEMLILFLGWLFLNKVSFYEKITKIKPYYWLLTFFIPLIFLMVYKVPDWSHDTVSWIKPVVVDLIILIPCLSLLGFAVTSPFSLKKFFDGKIIQRLGFYSFDIFVLHPPAIKFVSWLNQEGLIPKFLTNVFGGPFLVFVLALFLAWVSYSFITRPMLHLTKVIGSSSSRPTLESEK